MKPTDAVQTRNLCKTYPKAGKEPVHALDNVNLHIPEGVIFGLLGPNGAGKTTLVRILTTLLRPSQGTATVCGYDIQQEERQVQRIIGYAGQDSEHSAYFRLTVEENLIYFAHALRGMPVRAARERVREFAAAVNLTSQLGQYFSTLSGGQKQLVIVLRAMLHQPRVVFMDEPSKSLDPITAERVHHFLTDYVKAHHTTILLTTHNMGEAETICNQLAFISQGQLQFVGTPLQFRRSVRVQEIVRVAPAGTGNLLPLLQDIPGVNHTSSQESASGDGAIRLYSQDGFGMLSEVVARLKQAGIKALVSMEEPSLEDAYSIFVHAAQGAPDGG